MNIEFIVFEFQIFPLKHEFLVLFNLANGWHFNLFSQSLNLSLNLVVDQRKGFNLNEIREHVQVQKSEVTRSKNISVPQEMLEESFMGTMKTLIEAPETSPLAKVNLEDIGFFYIQLTRWKIKLKLVPF